MSKIGLVLEGGGMRGLYTVGALDVFDEVNFMPDYIVGVSAGACNGISYASKQHGRAYRVIMDNIENPRYVGFGNFIKTKSMFGMDFIFDEIPHNLDLFDYDTLLASQTEFVTGVTDVDSGQAVFFPKEALNHSSILLRASSSIPVFAPMVEIEGKKYLDGGTSCPIPFEQALNDGCDKLVVVLTQHRGYRKSAEKMRFFYHRIYKKHPKMIETIDCRHDVYNRQLERIFELEREGKAIVIAPSEPVSLGRFEKGKAALHELYCKGKADTRAVISGLLSFCKINV